MRVNVLRRATVARPTHIICAAPKKPSQNRDWLMDLTIHSQGSVAVGVEMGTSPGKATNSQIIAARTSGASSEYHQRPWLARFALRTESRSGPPKMKNMTRKN